MYRLKFQTNPELPTYYVYSSLLPWIDFLRMYIGNYMPVFFKAFCVSISYPIKIRFYFHKAQQIIQN